MKLAYSKICINPSFPIKQAGFIQQTQPIFNFHDDLHARILVFDDGVKIVYHISVDLLYLSIECQRLLKTELERIHNRTVIVTITATHTHFGGNPHDIRYQGEIISKILYAAQHLIFVESDSFKISYQCVPFNGVGTSRISNHKANVLLQYYTIYNCDEPIIGIIVHNCHPTIHNGYTPYFTSEYPGYVVETLTKRHPGMEFTFMQGAAGDISTRFTRPSQDYKAVVYLGDKLAEEVERLMKEDKEIVSFDNIEYESTVLPLEHEFNPIDLTNIPNNLTERELETIRIGAQVRENLSKKLETLDKQILISKLELGPYKFVFCPNEIFSNYIDYVNIEKTSLVAYSNGHSPYMTGVNDDFITYEKFTDTTTVETKKKYIKILQEYGK